MIRVRTPAVGAGPGNSPPAPSGRRARSRRNARLTSGARAPARSVLRNFPGDEKGVHTIHPLGGKQKSVVLYEASLYRMIFNSRQPEAFKTRVFNEVLPSLRKSGSYPRGQGEPESEQARQVTGRVAGRHVEDFNYR